MNIQFIKELSGVGLLLVVFTFCCFDIVTGYNLLIDSTRVGIIRLGGFIMILFGLGLLVFSAYMLLIVYDLASFT